MQASAILHCQYSGWFPAFGHLGFKSRIIELPKNFADFLVQDGVFLPESSAALPRRAAPADFDDNYREWDEENEPQNAGEGDEVPEFADLRAEIDAAIEVMGGKVAPKFTWSSPHDATWVSGNHSLACSSADEVLALLESSDRWHDMRHKPLAHKGGYDVIAVLLLLKSSDRVAHDICHAFDACAFVPNEPVQHALALRKWIALKPERELRCFVKQHDLIAISQRNILENPDGLQCQGNELREMMLEFFEEHIQDQFPEDDYTFDVYITTAGKIRLLDFNPIGGATCPLLFEWEELGYSVSASASADNAVSAAAENSAESPLQPVTRDSQPNADAPASLPAQPQSSSETAPESLDRQTDAAAGLSEGGPHASGSGAMNEHGHTNGNTECTEIMVRFAEPGSSMLRPASALYGAPYDMADLSEGSAIAEMLRKMQIQEETGDMS